MRKKILYIIAVWTFIFFLYKGLEGFGIVSYVPFIQNLMAILLLIYLVIVPILIILLAKKKAFRIFLSIMVSTYFIVAIGPLFLMGMFWFNDLYSGNADRIVVEKELNDGSYFAIYVTHDDGALGGRWPSFVKYDKLILGFVKITKINGYEVQYDSGSKSDTIPIHYNNERIEIERKFFEDAGLLN